MYTNAYTLNVMCQTIHIRSHMQSLIMIVTFLKHCMLTLFLYRFGVFSENTLFSASSFYIPYFSRTIIMNLIFAIRKCVFEAWTRKSQISLRIHTVRYAVYNISRYIDYVVVSLAGLDLNSLHIPLRHRYSWSGSFVLFETCLAIPKKLLPKL